MPEPTFSVSPLNADAATPIRFLPPTLTTYEIRDAEGRTVRVGTILNGDFTMVLSEPNYTFTTTIYRTRSGDGRGSNAYDCRKARRSGRLWRSLGEVVRDSDDAPDALDMRWWTPRPSGEWKVTS